MKRIRILNQAMKVTLLLHLHFKKKLNLNNRKGLHDLSKAYLSDW